MYIDRGSICRQAVTNTASKDSAHQGLQRYARVPHPAMGWLKSPSDAEFVAINHTAAPPKECNTSHVNVTQTQKASTQTKVTNLKVAINPITGAKRYHAENSITMTDHQPIMVKKGAMTESVSPCGYPVKCFLGTIQGVSPIQMAKDDEEETAFHDNPVKGQILADFLIEKLETDAVLPQSEVKLQDLWILFTDGSACVDGSGAGLILTNPEGMEFTYALRFDLLSHNTEAEYEALIAGHACSYRMGVRNLEANVDSRLVANHVLGEYVAKEDNMIQYLNKTKSLIQSFDRFTIRQVPRGDNKKANALSKNRIHKL
ncbi:reverse transcriptase domain-containing protein [Tanacetum coccineum]